MILEEEILGPVQNNSQTDTRRKPRSDLPFTIAYAALALRARQPLRHARKARFSWVKTILSSRASQPMAQSKTGPAATTSFFSFANVISPFASRACHRSEERRVGKEGRSRWSPYP